MCLCVREYECVCVCVCAVLQDDREMNTQQCSLLLAMCVWVHVWCVVCGVWCVCVCTFVVRGATGRPRGDYTAALNAARNVCVWSVECGVWCVVCGVWCVVCGVWCVECGVWSVECGVWCVVCGVWYVVCGVWCVACGVCACVWCVVSQNDRRANTQQRSLLLAMCVCACVCTVSQDNREVNAQQRTQMLATMNYDSTAAGSHSYLGDTHTTSSGLAPVGLLPEVHSLSVSFSLSLSCMPVRLLSFSFLEKHRRSCHECM